MTGVRWVARISLLISLCLLAAAARAQTGVPNLEPNRKLYTPVPTITFTYALEGAQPGHYSIALESSGKAAYQAEEIPQGGTAGAPYSKKFVVTSPAAAHIFELAAQANLFQGNFDFKERKIANMGAKTLSFADASHYNETTYNYSTNPVIQQVTAFFQGLSETLEFGRRLAFEHRYERLGLDQELKYLQARAEQKQLPELQLNVDILQAIANDTAVMNITRRRAQALLTKIQAAQGEPKPAPTSQ